MDFSGSGSSSSGSGSESGGENDNASDNDTSKTNDEDSQPASQTNLGSPGPSEQHHKSDSGKEEDSEVNLCIF